LSAFGAVDPLAAVCSECPPVKSFTVQVGGGGTLAVDERYAPDSLHKDTAAA
jgi:hypothetical protein